MLLFSSWRSQGATNLFFSVLQRLFPGLLQHIDWVCRGPIESVRAYEFRSAEDHGFEMIFEHKSPKPNGCYYALIVLAAASHTTALLRK